MLWNSKCSKHHKKAVDYEYVCKKKGRRVVYLEWQNTPEVKEQMFVCLLFWIEPDIDSCYYTVF